MAVQPGLCRTWSELKLLVFSRTGSYVINDNVHYVSRDYEDIRCEEADQVILERVKAGEEINLPNGKLLERLLTIKLYRESKYMHLSRILY